jgi:ribonucleoside-diphosphate reductase alpha chain
MTSIFVTKRSGETEPFNINKIHRVLEWACNDLIGVSISEIEMRANVQLYNEMESVNIHDLLIKSSAELITESTPNYQTVAARLINYKLKKVVYGDKQPWALKEIIDHNIEAGVYDEDILNQYSESELDYIDSHIIDHSRDDDFTYAGMEQMRSKYLVQNRSTGVIYETPQVLYIMIAMTLFSKYNGRRMQYVKDFYNATSQFYISLPTPIMAGVRTPTRQFSSCVVLETNDSLDSINATSTSIVKYISKKAGLGINAGKIRAVGSHIGDGSVVHTGMIPFLKLFQASVKSCSQGGVRGGAATVYMPVWHYEFEDLVVLKNNRGTDETRVRNMDYAFQFNKLMYERLLTGGNITFFSPHDVPGLYDAFFEDQDKFKELYEKYEKTRKIRKKSLPALEVFSQFLTERKETGRIYLQNVDHANTHGSFIEKQAPIHQSNLCCEITLPSYGLESYDDANKGEISLCTLSAINWGLINDPKDFEKYCDLAVRSLDALLDYQDYPVLAAQRSTMNRRPLGIGIINFAYFLAKRGLKYNDEALETVDEYAEAWSYYLIKSSVNLAKERGKCYKNLETKYGHGILPIDTYKQEVNELVKSKQRMPWSALRKELLSHGIRNSTLMAIMPAETSAQISNSTNGIEPPRALVSYKQSKDGVMAQVVPNIHNLKNKYDLLWDQEGPEGYLKIMAVLQKYIDQGISVNTSYNPAQYEDNKVPMSEMMKDLITFYKYGGKQLYYFNTNDQATEDESTMDYERKDFKSDQEYDDYCESCVL